MSLCTEEILCTQKMGTALRNEPFHPIETNILFCICSYHPLSRHASRFCLQASCFCCDKIKKLFIMPLSSPFS